MSTPKPTSFIDIVAGLEGAAIVLSSIECGRVIGQVARGFHEDPEVHAQASIYLALKALYPETVVAYPKMHARMLSNAPDNSDALKGAGLSEAEQKEWAAAMGESEADRLRNSIKPLMALMQEEGPSADLKAWFDLPVLAQHSLAVRTERNLKNAVARYATWDSEEGVHLYEVSKAAVDPITAAVSALCEANKDELDKARSEGVNVAQRIAA